MTNSKPTPIKIQNILRAVQNCNESEVLKLLGEVPNSPDFHWSEISYKQTGDTLLHYAARNNQVNVIKYVLENFKPKLVDCKNKDDKTALHEAAQFSQFEACAVLLSHGANINSLKRSDWTPLMLACAKSKGETTLKTVELLLSHHPMVDYKNKDGWSCLHMVARDGDENILKVLITFGIELRSETRNGKFALHIAALHGNLKILKILFEYNLDVDKRDSSGYTPLCEAVLGNNLKVCQQLVNNNADINVVVKCGYSIIHLAACQGNVDILRYIVDVLNFDVNFENQKKTTPLHCAAKQNMKEAYAFLVENGASEDKIDVFGRKPLDYLVSRH